jgi:hypothetical protein
MAKKLAKKQATKTAKRPAASDGAAELREFKAAIQNLRNTGMAMAKVARKNTKMREKGALQAAVDKLQDTTERLVKAIPTTPPSTTVSQ